MGKLIKTPNLARPDDVYQILIDLHAGCDEATSHERNAKLILTLANHIGDGAVIFEAAKLAQDETAQGDDN